MLLHNFIFLLDIKYIGRYKRHQMLWIGCCVWLSGSIWIISILKMLLTTWNSFQMFFDYPYSFIQVFVLHVCLLEPWEHKENLQIKKNPTSMTSSLMPLHKLIPLQTFSKAVSSVKTTKKLNKCVSCTMVCSFGHMN